MNKNIKIGVVGPCASGKSTLITRLKAQGLNVHHIAQEHSYAPAMWERISHPQVLIFLDVSYPVSQQRRMLDWTEKDYEEQRWRLRHAREHAHLYLNTDELGPEEVYERVRAFLEESHIQDEAL
jgi:ATPase subunit of ABC transporter with duplicated ATPase domains